MQRLRVELQNLRRRTFIMNCFCAYHTCLNTEKWLYITMRSHERHSVWNHGQIDCLCSSLMRMTIKTKPPNSWFFVRWHVDFCQKGPVIRKVLPGHDVIIIGYFSLFQKLFLVNGIGGITEHIFFQKRSLADILSQLDIPMATPGLMVPTIKTGGKVRFEKWMYVSKCLEYHIKPISIMLFAIWCDIAGRWFVKLSKTGAFNSSIFI